MITKIPASITILFILLFFPGIISTVDSKPNKKDLLQFEVYNNTLKYFKLEYATLYFSPDRLFKRTDSVAFEPAYGKKNQDTLYLSYPWKFPVHAWVKFNYSDRIRTSNTFYLDPLIGKWQIFINDTAVLIKAKPKFSFEEKTSYLGIILIIQALIQLLIAAIIIRLLHWPAWVLLIILVANLAAFPVYMLNIQPSFLSEAIMLLTEFIVMTLLARRRLGTLRILGLVFTLTLISFGIKELLIIISKLI